MVNLRGKKGHIEIMPNIRAMRHDLQAIRVNNEQTFATIKNVYQRYGIILDPHGAVGYEALRQALHRDPNRLGVVWETADPCKFPDVVKKATGVTPPLAPNMAKQVNLSERRFMIFAPAKKMGSDLIAHSEAQYLELLNIVADQIQL